MSEPDLTAIQEEALAAIAGASDLAELESVRVAHTGRRSALATVLASIGSLPPERRMSFSWTRANPMGSLRLLARHRELLGLAGVFFLYHLAHVVLPAVAVLYTSYRYGWDGKTMGLTLAAVGVASGIVQAGLIRPTVERLGERVTLILGLLFGVAGFAIYGLATTSEGFWAGIPVMAHIGLTSVHQDVRLIGATAVDLLIDRMDAGRSRPRHVVLTPSFTVRSTTAPPDGKRSGEAQPFGVTR